MIQYDTESTEGFLCLRQANGAYMLGHPRFLEVARNKNHRMGRMDESNSRTSLDMSEIRRFHHVQGWKTCALFWCPFSLQILRGHQAVLISVHDEKRVKSSQKPPTFGPSWSDKSNSGLTRDFWILSDLFWSLCDCLSFRCFRFKHLCRAWQSSCQVSMERSGALQGPE